MENEIFRKKATLNDKQWKGEEKIKKIIAFIEKEREMAKDNRFLLLSPSQNSHKTSLVNK